MKIQITRLHRKVVPGFTLAALLASTGLQAQTQNPPAAETTAPADAAAEKLSAEDLSDLLGPIALYPDALVSIILPASTVPSDITMAARYLAQNGSEADVSDQPWDPSVRSLAEYPDVLKWMDDNLEWTTSLGEAFVVQPADVMNSVQALRLAAKEKGNLKNTPQQTVVVEEQPATDNTPVQEIVRIVPTDPEVIYVPVYDPQVVYVQEYQPDYTPFITFGVGLAVGSWLSYDCNWWGRDIYYGDNYGWNNRNRWNGDRGYYDRNDNVNVINTNTNINNTNVNNFTTNNTTVNRWQPTASSQRQFNQRQREGTGNARIARENAKALSSPNVQKPGVNSGRVRPASVAKPKMPAVIAQNTRKKHPNNKVTGNANQATPGKAPNANRGNPNANGNKPNAGNKPGQTARPKSPTTAPKISDGDTGKRPNANKPGGNADRGNPNAGKKPKPSTAPAQNGGNANKPNKNPGNGNNNNQADRPKPNKPKPSTAPQQSKPQQSKPKPQAQPKPQQSKPKPQVQAKPQQSKPKPQAQPRPQQSKPKPQAQPRPQQSKPKPQAQPRPQQSKPKPQAQPRPQQSKPKPQAKPQQQQAKPQAQQRPQGNGENKKKKKDND